MKGCDNVPTGSRIKEIRKQKGLTQKQLGEKCGMYESQIRKYENGKANPKIETLEKIATGLGVQITDLIDDNTLSITNDMLQLFSDGNITTIEPSESSNAQEHYLISKFRELNNKGQQKTIDYVEDISQLPEYQKE